jgi:hypothetical protein
LSLTHSEEEARAAVERLTSAGVAAFPELSMHVQDETRTPMLGPLGQTGYPIDAVPSDTRLTVGELCFAVIVWQVENYHWSKIMGDRYSALTPDTAARWIAQHKGKSIEELRRAAAQESLLLIDRDLAMNRDRPDLLEFRQFMETRAQGRAD